MVEVRRQAHALVCVRRGAQSAHAYARKSAHFKGVAALFTSSQAV